MQIGSCPTSSAQIDGLGQLGWQQRHQSKSPLAGKMVQEHKQKHMVLERELVQHSKVLVLEQGLHSMALVLEQAREHSMALALVLGHSKALELVQAHSKALELVQAHSMVLEQQELRSMDQELARRIRNHMLQLLGKKGQERRMPNQIESLDDSSRKCWYGCGRIKTILATHTVWVSCEGRV